MNAEFDYDLTPDQWETLKRLRCPPPKARALIDPSSRISSRFRLAEMTDEPVS